MDTNTITIKSVLNKFYVFSHKNNDSNVQSSYIEKVKCGGHLELIKILNDTKKVFCIKRCFKYV